MAVPLKDKVFVVLQFLVFLLYIPNWSRLQFSSPFLLKIFGMSLVLVVVVLALTALLQLSDKISPFPSPVKNSVLRTRAAFAFSRHPIYTGILMAAIGVASWLGSGYKLVISLLLFLLFYFKSRYEEQKLEEKFAEYRLYKKRTGRFLPKLMNRIR